jgi:hypothetical protein
MMTLLLENGALADICEVASEKSPMVIAKEVGHQSIIEKLSCYL